MNKVKEHIVDWLKTSAIKSKQNGYVIGVSGGIDSAVISTLCALTGLRVIVLDIPIHQSSDEVNRAKKHMDWLCENFKNVEQTSFDLTSTFDQFSDNFNAMNPNADAEMLFLALANTRSRLRMSVLYSVSNINRCSGNKVEDFGIGFFTKGGDGMVDVSPIGDLMKSEVYRLGAELGIIEDILNARPTDGLWTDGRTDEDQIGATYDELEWAMNTQSVYGNDPSIHIKMTSRESSVWDIYIKRHLANKHKMVMPPICSLEGIKEEVI